MAESETTPPLTAETEKLQEKEVTSATESFVDTSTRPPSVHSNKEKIEEEARPAENADEASPDQEEIVYPGLLTKIGVGIGLALAVFLVSFDLFAVLIR